MEKSYRDMLAGKLLVGIPNKESIPGVLSAISKYHIGGVILYKNNYNSVEEMIELINKLKKANEEYDIPLFIAIDQEGGRVNRLPKEIENIKSAYRMNKSGLNAIKESSKIMAKLLHDLGINMNFAPVLDIRNQKDDNAFIGNRAYSNNPDDIIKAGRIFIEEYNKAHVIPVCKHYPGHGSINIDSHFFLPIISKFTRDSLDLKPFNELGNLSPAIMISHILIRGYTNLKPASLSKAFINDFLRKENNYSGLVVTDELGMKAVRVLYGKYNSVKLAYKAKNDLICCKYSYNYIDTLLDMLESDLLVDKQFVEDSFNKIVDYKRKYKLSDNEVSYNININNINKQIKEVNELEETE